MKISKILLLLFLTPLCIFSQNKKRLALVIGISNYSNTLKLENPVNDARLITSSLKEVNFEVILKEDVSKKELADAIKVFSNKLIDSNYEAGFFYYAGHGIQVENTNYLVPIDANIDQNNDKYEIEEKCYSVQRLMSYFNSERLSDKVLISVLDACRNNPFIRNRSIGEGGLSKIDAVSGSLIAYSTEPGKVALDGKGKANSIYSEVLSKNLKTPNLTLEEVFKNVRTEVENQTNYKQSPREESALKGAPFYFSNKKNNNKIDIIEIENEFKSLIASRSFEKAISKGNTLKELFKSKGDSIIYSKYVDILIELSNVYYKCAEDSSKNEEWVYYYKLASNDLLEAVSILNKNNFNSKEDKYRFSKSLINYIHFQSFLDEKERHDNYNELVKKGKELISFNEINFGLNSYFTASSYFINGWLNRDSSYLEAYKYYNKAYDYFKNNYYNRSIDTGYYFKNNINYYSVKWKIKIISRVIDNILTQNKSLYYNNHELNFQTIDKEINTSIELITHENNDFKKDYYEIAAGLYNNYGVLLSDNYNMEILAFKRSINLSEKQLELANNFVDSISFINRWCNSSINLILNETKNDNPSTTINEIERNIEIALKKAIDKKDIFCISFSYRSYFDFFYRLYKIDSLYFNKINLERNLDLFNNNFIYFINELKNLDENNKKLINNQVKELFANLKSVLSIVQDLDYKYKKEETEQFIDISTVCFDGGYGSPFYLAALEHKAVILGESNNELDILESKKTYKNLIKIIEKSSLKWQESNLSGCYINTNNKNDCIANLLSDVYYNYTNNIIVDSQHIKNREDSLLVFSYQDFLKKYELNLKNINKYFYSSTNSCLLSYFYFQSKDTNQAIKYCDSAIFLLNTRINLVSTESESDFLSLTQSEELISQFYKQKLDLLKNYNSKIFELTRIEFQNRLSKYKNYDVLAAQLECMYYLANTYFNDKHDYKNTQKICYQAIDKFNEYIKSKDFLNTEYSEIWKLYLLDLFREIAVWGCENSCNPSYYDRKKVIDISQFIVNFINQNWNKNDVVNEYDIYNRFLRTLYTIEDLSFFNEDYKTAIFYGSKRLEVLNSINKQDSHNTDFMSELSYQLGSLSTYYLNDGDTSNAHDTYLQKLSKSKYSETSIKRIFSYSIDTLSLNSCNASFLHVKFRTPINVWPCLEFDINNNSKIDSNIDKRYFIDNNNALKKEYIVNLNRNIGGYKWFGYNETGRKNDTSKTIYFDESKSFLSNAYYNLSHEILSDSLQFAKLENGEKINLWEFHIPVDDLLNKDDSTITFLIEAVSYEPCTNTLCRVYKKNTIPTIAYFTGFKDCIKIKIK